MVDTRGRCSVAISWAIVNNFPPSPTHLVMLKPISPADEVKGMVIRRMSQKFWANQEVRMAARDKEVEEEVRNIMVDSDSEEKVSLSSQMADNDKAMLELQRRVEGEGRGPSEVLDGASPEITDRTFGMPPYLL